MLSITGSDRRYAEFSDRDAVRQLDEFILRTECLLVMFECGVTQNLRFHYEPHREEKMLFFICTHFPCILHVSKLNEITNVLKIEGLFLFIITLRLH